MFFVTEFQAQRREYCSNSCRGKAAQKQVERTCRTCGKTFRLMLSRAQRAKFCSHACRRFYGGETGIERDVRLALTQLKIDYMQEHYIRPYRIDFYLPQWQVALEVDGLYWHNPERDNKRDHALAAIGVTTIRITDVELNKAPCLDVVVGKLQHLFGP
jgi:very-short-patch-repair endonuclease